MIVVDVFFNGTAKRAFPKEDHLAQAFGFDAAEKAFDERNGGMEEWRNGGMEIDLPQGWNDAWILRRQDSKFFFDSHDFRRATFHSDLRSRK